MPASSPAVSSITSTLNFLRSAQRAYMRNSMRAQSQLSVPPAPECTSMNVSLPSASPENSASIWRSRASFSSALSWATPSFSVAASFSASPSSTSVSASSRSRSKRAIEPSWSSSSVRSRMIFCAASASFQRLGSSTRAFSSARRRVAVSTSKMPPQQSHGLLDLFFQRKRLGAHVILFPIGLRPAARGRRY